MKFNYTRKQGEQSFEARLDTDVIFNAVLVKQEQGDVLVLQTTLEPEEVVEQTPIYKKNKDGSFAVVEYRPTKLKKHPIIEIVVPEEIDEFMRLWK